MEKQNPQFDEYLPKSIDFAKPIMKLLRNNS